MERILAITFIVGLILLNIFQYSRSNKLLEELVTEKKNHALKIAEFESCQEQIEKQSCEIRQYELDLEKARVELEKDTSIAYDDYIIREKEIDPDKGKLENIENMVFKWLGANDE